MPCFVVLSLARGPRRVYIGRLRRDVCDPVRPILFGVGFVGYVSSFDWLVGMIVDEVGTA